VIIGSYTKGKTAEKYERWAAALQQGRRDRRIELTLLGGE